MPDPALLPPLLLPAPRRVSELCHAVDLPATPTVGGPWADLVSGILDWPTSDQPWLAIRSAEQPAGGYALDVTPDGAVILAGDEAGVRHACATLRQLLAQYGRRLPGVQIEDAPAFATRGVLLDISRDRVPTMEHLLALVEQLAGWKINHLQLYTEAAFAYAGHDAVWRDGSPITADELRALDAHCRRHGIELVANQACFGHLERWFAHDAYAGMAEIAPGQTWDFAGIATKTGGFSLCPEDPRSLPFVAGLLDQLLPNVAAPLVNIGGDETYDLGQGRSQAAVAERGRAAVYLDFLNRICDLVRARGRRPAFWADIALEHPEALDRLPADLLCLVWAYEGDAPFDRWLRQIRATGREAWVCPGTSCWRSITGRTAERRANLAAAADQGLAAGATGWLGTAWGDLGYRQQWPITLNGLAECAQRAWAGGGALPVVHPKAVSLHAFADRSLQAGRWLDDLGDCDRELRLVCGRPRADGSPGPLRNATALFTDLHRPLALPMLGHHQGWRDCWEYLLPLRNLPVGVDDLLRDEMLFSWRTAVFACRRALARDRTVAADERRSMAETMTGIINDHRRLWLRRSRPGGLDRSTAAYQPILDELQAS
jgi:hexosaminidase